MKMRSFSLVRVVDSERVEGLVVEGEEAEEEVEVVVEVVDSEEVGDMVVVLGEGLAEVLVVVED